MEDYLSWVNQPRIRDRGSFSGTYLLVGKKLTKSKLWTKLPIVVEMHREESDCKKRSSRPEGIEEEEEDKFLGRDKPGCRWLFVSPKHID
ncbi:MAG: hypothetical protein UX49_C0037G0004 [Candidatus Wolfebacteria bacterium GW2011_GWC2_46_275]|nr:MAG: hypothetical protein UX49_C0037G0004 [Candidatus Wolfebacteria bacterium GW2011_GWC2_46_275]KKU42078.1 MAG: hypothetical protein UX58_C0003G0002 [Candidatus Wolfebacteria bacterium GW2011_GWB2_46_69]KKU53709.1 MAG: hypothetical protein UX76_C0011G0054 [Candidatus Wolfebacteria bacterium GW2011_GWC1_47_103]KKU59333.1 MAG: hypothetical protein UX83_C0006G0103 [Candidatus Wolfebacteria bacterium GW2011_GWE2_47_12]KKU70788.1 MAG: hypothetical protein UX96_C0037G0009 [Candidatus Wolfebacteri